MIIYKANGNWIGHFWHLAKSWTMVKVFRGVLLFGAYTGAICYLHFNFFPDHDKSALLSIFSLLGVVLSILLVFRTNNSYDRWWEGRKLWGSLVNNTRNIAVISHSMLPTDNVVLRGELVKKISNFCHALVEHLREGVVIDKLVGLNEAEISKYENVNHIPNCISNEIYQLIYDTKKRGEIDESDFLNFGALHKTLLEISGSCERIKKTPIPFSYAVFMKIFIGIYGVLLPFALMSQIGYFTVPVVMLTMFAFLGIELMGEEIEDPFGLDCNNLPTGTIASMIEDNVCEMLCVGDKKPKTEKREMYSKIF
jgi:putative membrane protein